jgi:retinol-binding protein 3
MKPVLVALALHLSLLGPFIKPCFAQGNPVQTSPSISKPEIRELVESFTQSLNKNYLFPEKAATIGNYIRKQYRQGAYHRIKDQQTFAVQFNKDLYQVSRDRHLRIFYDPKMVKQLEQPPLSEKEMQKVREKQLAAARENNFGFKKIEILPGNLGYVRMDEFYGGDIPAAKPTMTSSFQFLKNTQAIIIDLRYNGGGSPISASQIQSYFFDQKMHMLDVLEPANNKTYELFADPANADGIMLNMPVYILTSKNTASGAEGFSYDLQSVKRATIVGDITAGAANMLPAPYKLAHGFLAEIPIARPYNRYTKTNWEAIGIQPDIAVPAEKALTKAQAAFLNDLLQKATDEREKRRLQWHLNTLQASEITVMPDLATLNQYVGMYQGGLDFYVKEGRLFCKNGEANDDIFELKLISGSLFTLDGNAQVQFEKDDTGAYSKLKVFMRWGDIKEKSKI